MMNWLIDNFYGIIVMSLLFGGLGCGFYLILTNSNNKQKEIILTWLLQAVIEAEKKFGSKSGQLKLSYVYDLYITKFPIMARIIPKRVFLIMVDEAIKQMIIVIENSVNVQNYVRDDII